MQPYMESSWTLQQRQEKPLPSLHKINRKDQNLRFPATTKTPDPAQLPGPAAKITKAKRDIVCILSKKGAAGRRRRRRRRRNRKMLLPATGGGGVSVVVVVGVVSLATAGVSDAISAPASFFFTSLIKSKNMNSESKEETQNQLPFFHSKKRKQTNAPNLSFSVPLPRPCLFSLSLSRARSLPLSLSLSVALSLVVHAVVHSGENYWQRGR